MDKFCCDEAHMDIFDEMSLVVRKPVFGVSDEVPHKPGSTTTQVS